MNIILPGQHRGNIEIDVINSRVKLLADRPLHELRFAKKNLNRYYTNGLAHYLKKVRLSVVTDLAECQKIWQQFSTEKSLFELWDFRLAFQKSYGNKPYFMTLTQGSEIVACLPLTYQSSLKAFTWFGSDWMENNSWFTTDPMFIPILLYFAPRPLILDDISETSAKLLPDFVQLVAGEPNYHLNLKKYGQLEFYLQSLPKKKRYNFKRDYQRIAQLNPQVEVNNLNHFKTMVSLTKKRFRDKEELADFEEDPYIEGAFHNLLHSPSDQFELKMQTVTINGRVAATDMLAFYQDTVYPLRGGNDVGNFSGIGNYINYLEIADAFEGGFKKIDFLSYGYGWKQNYLESEPRYKINLAE